MNVQQKIPCPICGQNCFLIDVVDFNKSCEEAKGKFLPLSGIPIYYVLCENCAFCFAPEIAKWPLREFEEKIYNEEYIDVDPEYAQDRPLANAKTLQTLFSANAGAIKHLDYGGGTGVLAKALKAQGWNSSSYDPLVNKDVKIDELGQFDLISAFEVFEHVPDVHVMMKELKTLLAPGGIVLFSTLSTDGNIQKNARITWWYASPRNGHISLFSKTSLAILGVKYGFNFGSFNSGLHVFYTTAPVWASHLIK